MIMKFRFYTTLTIFIIGTILHLFYNELNYLSILDIGLLFIIAFVFPFFEFRTNSPLGIPVLIFFLFNVSIFGKSISKLDLFFNQKDIMEEWVVKSFIVLSYGLILVSNFKRRRAKTSG